MFEDNKQSKQLEQNMTRFSPIADVDVTVERINDLPVFKQAD